MWARSMDAALCVADPFQKRMFVGFVFRTAAESFAVYLSSSVSRDLKVGRRRLQQAGARPGSRVGQAVRSAMQPNRLVQESNTDEPHQIIA